MPPVKWMVITILLITLPLHIVASSSSACEEEIGADYDVARMLTEELDKIKTYLKLQNVIIIDILSPRYEAIALQNEVNTFTILVQEQYKTIFDLKANLALHETSMNASLSRQEEQLSKLERQLLHLENQWRNQTSEIEQLRQLWGDLGNKSVARAAEVKALDHSIKGLEERLKDQRAKVEEQDLNTTNLESSVESAEETLKSLQDDLQDSLNTQGRLEGVLVSLQKEIAELRASGGGGSGGGSAAPLVVQTQADSLCKRIGRN